MIFDTTQLLSRSQDIDWEAFPDKEVSFGGLRWKIFAGGPVSTTQGITFGVCEIPEGGGMNPHNHSAVEYYYIQEGKGTVLLGSDVVPVKTGSIVYIPSDVVHAIRNTGTETLTLIWIFPTDRWSDVEYQPVVGESQSRNYR